MDRDKTRRALKEAMSKIGKRPKRKVSGMSPGKRRAITGSATGKTTREKLMDAFKKASEKRKKDRRTPTGGPAAPVRPAATAKQLQSRGMTPAQARSSMRGMGPRAMRQMAGAVTGIGSGVAMNKAIMKLAKKIKPTGRLNTDDLKNATAIMKQAMKTVKGTKGK
jgi:uncharacterized protein (DUF2342 family)